MPGSFPDPNSYDTAIHFLEEAYVESQGSHTGALILKAIAAITRLKEDVASSGNRGLLSFDPYEYDETNSAF